MNRKLKVLDLFSGIGGFALGLDSTGFFETVKFVEKDKYCQKVLRKNFPNIPIEEDIKNVKGKEYSADVVVGGFPCQPFSVAGKQKGTNDDRYLWPEMLRLIREIKPEFVIGENVQGIINLQNGMVLRQVQDELESEGFEVQCFLIPASGIGAWHQRYRVWIVGHSQHNGLLAAEKRCRDEKDYGGSQKRENETIEPTRASGSRNDEDLSRHGSSRETPSIKETIVSDTNNIRFERDQQTTETTSGRRTEATSQSSGEDVSNTTEIRSSTQSIRNIGSLGKESKTKERRKGNQSSVRTSSRSAEGRERRKENVCNTNNSRRKDRSEQHRWQQTQSKERINSSSRSNTVSRQHKKEDVSDTNTRLGIGENEEIQARRETIDSSSSRRGEEKNVSNTESIRSNEREPRNSEEKSREERQVKNEVGGDYGYGVTKNVSNTDSGLRGRGTTIGESGENKVWKFYSEEEEQTRVDIRSETIGRDVVSGEEEIILQSNNERQQELNTSKKSEGQTLDNRRYDKYERDATDTSSKRLQRRDPKRELQEQEFGFSSDKNDEKKQTWWQIESDLCGVPNGISYELDKDRANRIKTLGNAIVPQIAREFGLAIKKVLLDEDII